MREGFHHFSSGGEKERGRRSAGWETTLAVVATLLSSGGKSISAAEQSSSAAASVDAVAMLERGVSSTVPEISPPALSDVSEKVVFRGREYTREDFADIVRAGYNELLQGLDEDLPDAEACFYAYGDQLQSQTEVLAAATGKSPQQLEWNAAALREGLYHKSSGLGVLVRAVEIGRSRLPVMTAERRRNFYQDLYREHLKFLEEAWQSRDVEHLTSPERALLAQKLGRLIEARTNEAVMTATVRYQLEQGRNFEQWYRQGVGSGLPSGEQRWRDAQVHERTMIEELAPLDDPWRQRLAHEAAVRHTQEQQEIFISAAEKARVGLTGRLFGVEEASRWELLARQTGREPGGSI